MITCKSSSLKDNFRTSIMGYVAGIAYVLSVAFSITWLHSLGKNFSPILLLFVSAIISTVILNIINVRDIKFSYSNILLDKKNWFFMSFSLVFVWYFTYWSTIHSSAEFCIAIIFLVTALCSALASKEIIKILACLISIILVYHMSKFANYPAFIGASITGIASYSYYQFSISFSKNTNSSPFNILAIRFYIVILSATIIFLHSSDFRHISISLLQLATIAIFSIMNMVIPMILSQVSLQNVGVKNFTFITTLIPAATFTLDLLFSKQTSISMILLYILVTISLNLDKLKWFRRP